MFTLTKKAEGRVVKYGLIATAAVLVAAILIIDTLLTHILPPLPFNIPAAVPGVIIAIVVGVGALSKAEDISYDSQLWKKMGKEIDTAEAERLRHITPEDREDELAAIRTDAAKYLEGEDLERFMTAVSRIYDNPYAGEIFPLPREIIIARGQIEIVDQH